MKKIHISLVLVCLIVTINSSLLADSLTDTTWHFDYQRKGKGDFKVDFDKDGTFSGAGTSSELGMMVIKGTYNWIKENKFGGKFHIEACNHNYKDKGDLTCKFQDKGDLIKCKVYNGILPFGITVFLENTQHVKRELVKNDE